MTAKKNFNELTPAGKEARLTKYRQEREQYGNLNGLFRIVQIKDHGERDTKNGKVHAYGYRVVPAGEQNNDEGLKNGQFLWMNELVNLKGKAQIAIDIRQQWIDELAKADVKSVLASIDYKVNGQYRDVRSVYQRTVKKHAEAPAQATAPAQTQAPADDDLPF